MQVSYAHKTMAKASVEHSNLSYLCPVTLMLRAFNIVLFPQMGFMTQVWFSPCLQGTILQWWEKKWTTEDQLPLREAITGSNKGVEVHSREAIFGTSFPLAVHLFSLAHRNRGGGRGEQGSYSLWGLIPSLSPCVPFLIATLHCLLSTDVGRKWRDKGKKFGLTRYCWESTTGSWQGLMNSGPLSNRAESVFLRRGPEHPLMAHIL